MSEKVYRDSTKDCFIFVEFEYGDPSAPLFVRYTDMEYNKQLLGRDFVSLPTMNMLYPKLTGGLNDPACKIDLPLTAFSISLSKGEPVSDIKVTVWELVTGLNDSVAKIRFRGIANKAIRNFSGTKKVVQISVLQAKNYLEVASGLTADIQCVWALGRGGCGVNIEPLLEPATITSISRNVIAVSGLVSFATLNYFRDGFILKDGISIKIRDHGITNTLILTKNVPANWLYQSVDVYPGCNKTIEVCRATWGQEATFAGMGYAIPDYQPLIESP